MTRRIWVVAVDGVTAYLGSDIGAHEYYDQAVEQFGQHRVAIRQGFVQVGL